MSLGEGDPPSAAPTYFPADYSAGYLSDADLQPFQTMAVGLPPRVVDAALLKGMKQVGGWVGLWGLGALGGGRAGWEGPGDMGSVCRPLHSPTATMYPLTHHGSHSSPTLPV